MRLLMSVAIAAGDRKVRESQRSAVFWTEARFCDHERPEVLLLRDGPRANASRVASRTEFGGKGSYCEINLR